MSTLEAIVLGITQGLTEFLPISSTAHLRIVPAFAGWEDPGAAFTAVTQLGTMAAVLLYFRADLIRIGHAWLRSLRDPAERGARSVFDRDRADRARAGAADGGAGGDARPAARADHPPRRPGDRLRAGAGAGAGRVALRRDDHGRAVPRFRPAERGALLVPAVGARGGAERPAGVRLHPRRDRRSARGSGRPGDRDAAGLRGRLRVDRLPAPLPGAPLDDRVRGLPGGPGHAGSRPRGRRRDPLAGALALPPARPRTSDRLPPGPVADKSPAHRQIYPPPRPNRLRLVQLAW